MKRLIAPAIAIGFLLWLLIEVAIAGSATVNYTSAGSSPFATTTDGSGNNYSRQTIWDYSAAANGAGVDSNHGLTVAGEGSAGTATGGVFTVQGVTSMVPFLSNPGTPASWGIGVTGSAVPANAVYIGITSGGNLVGWNGAVTNAGTFAVQATLQASSATAIGTVNPTTIGNWGLAASTQNSTTPTNGALVMGQFNTTPTTITSGNVSPFQMDNAGNLLVNVKAGGGSGGTSSSFGSAFPATGTAIGLTNGTNMVGWSATTNYGTAPSAIAVPAVNAFVTNTNANIGTNADGIPASPTIASPVASFAFLYNGTTWDRQQEAASTGTGALSGATLVNSSSQYPSGATAITASGTGTTTSFLTTLAGTSGKTTYLCGFSARALATAAANGQLTVSNTITANMSYLQWIAPLASGIGIVEEVYNPCVPATGTNTGIGIGTANPGAGGVQSVSAWGYQK